MSKDTGGPAFPSNRDMRHNPDWDWEGGMTLRDYFAAKALQGMLTCPTDFEEEKQRREDYDSFAMDFAESAYIMADAMLKAREA